MLLSRTSFSSHDFEIFHKYNGKTVVLNSFCDIFFSETPLMVCFYSSSLRAALAAELKILLKIQKVVFFKIKKKNFSLVLSLNSRNLVMDSLSFNNLKKFSSVSSSFLLFASYFHFCHFLNNLKSKLFKKTFLVLFVKSNTQIMLYNSPMFIRSDLILKTFSFDLVALNSFFFFSQRFIVSYFLLILWLNFEKKFYFFIS